MFVIILMICMVGGSQKCRTREVRLGRVVCVMSDDLCGRRVACLCQE